MTSERARPECDVRSRNALAAGTEKGYVVISFKLSFSTFKSVYFQFFVPILK